MFGLFKKKEYTKEQLLSLADEDLYSVVTTTINVNLELEQNVSFEQLNLPQKYVHVLDKYIECMCNGGFEELISEEYSYICPYLLDALFQLEDRDYYHSLDDFVKEYHIDLAHPDQIDITNFRMDVFNYNFNQLYQEGNFLEPKIVRYIDRVIDSLMKEMHYYK